MTTEQKAKAYDEALKRAKATFKVAQNQKEVYGCITTIFPELKESEDVDKKIREEIIATIHLYYGEPLEDEAKEMIAWLEKQGTSYTKRDVDNAYVEGMAFTKNELEKQKLADKIGSEFHEGDWVDNPIDACYEMIINLHELKLL